MNAFIVLAGGGVKGPVLAGCVKAAIDKGVVPFGYGGTSAGSIVATLAALGFTGDQLKEITSSMEFIELLDDGGKKLDSVQSELIAISEKLKGWLGRKLTAFSNLSSIKKTLGQQYGLYQGEGLRAFLVGKICEKYPALTKDQAHIATFDELARLGMRPLKVVATDLGANRAVVFGTDTERSRIPVVEAVAASACYPFLFAPVQIDGMWLSDGGLSSNLPAFLFEREYRESRIPTLAFDLLSINSPAFQAAGPPDYQRFAKALLNSALEASDVLIRESTPGVEYFAIDVPDGIKTLDFRMSQGNRDHCFDRGYAQTSEKLEKHPSIVRSRLGTGELKANLQNHFGPPRYFETILDAIIGQITLLCPDEVNLGRMRAQIMLLTNRRASQSSRIVTYSIGMESDPDCDLELEQSAGCSGKAWEERNVVVADLIQASHDPSVWRLTPAQQSKIPKDICSMISAPILGNLRSKAMPVQPIGTISVDCQAKLVDTGWWDEKAQRVNPDVVSLMKLWASIVGEILP